MVTYTIVLASVGMAYLLGRLHVPKNNVEPKEVEQNEDK